MTDNEKKEMIEKIAEKKKMQVGIVVRPNGIFFLKKGKAIKVEGVQVMWKSEMRLESWSFSIVRTDNRLPQDKRVEFLFPKEHELVINEGNPEAGTCNRYFYGIDSDDDDVFFLARITDDDEEFIFYANSYLDIPLMDFAFMRYEDRADGIWKSLCTLFENFREEKRKSIDGEAGGVEEYELF